MPQSFRLRGLQNRPKDNPRNTRILIFILCFTQCRRYSIIMVGGQDTGKREERNMSKKTRKKSAVKQSAKKKPVTKAAKETRRNSLLSAALKVLSHNGGETPLRLGEILTKINSKHLWQSPHGCKGLSVRQALSAAIQRSIRKPDSPFCRAGRGLFTAKQ